MRPAVTAAWHAFSAPLEGRVHSMYLDVKGLVTTGVGNLIDSPTAAAGLLWRHADGSIATAAEITAAWQQLKARKDLAKKSTSAAAALNDLRLDDAEIDRLIERQLLGNDQILAKAFPAWHDWPADAQLAAHSLAWAAGAGWPAKFPLCAGLLRDGKFALAGCVVPPDLSGVMAAPANPSGLSVKGQAMCDLRAVGNPGVIPRNALNRCHFIAASSELAAAYPDVLHGPCTLAALRAGWQPAAKISDIDSPGG